jgi:DNA-directed RNA polymerase subunit RPC12/RpoP
MLYCPGCNNTHWTATGKFRVLAFLRLKRELKCGKCGKIMFGSIFVDTGTAKKERRVLCPTCKARSVRSRRTALERLLIVVRPYRCQECKLRFHKLHLTN